MDGLIQMLPPSLRKFSTHIDFVGQRRAERIFQVILVLTAVIGYFVGYATQQLSYAMYSLSCGFVLSCLLVVPPWPYLRRNPIHWQQPIQTIAPSSANASSKEKKKTK